MNILREILLAAAIGGLGAGSALAQQEGQAQAQQGAQPAGGERPSWAVDRPEQSEAAEQLAPIPAPPLPTPAEDLPIEQISLPDGKGAYDRRELIAVVHDAIVRGISGAGESRTTPGTSEPPPERPEVEVAVTGEA